MTEQVKAGAYDFESQLELGEMLLNLGRVNEAEVELRKARELNAAGSYTLADDDPQRQDQLERLTIALERVEELKGRSERNKLLAWLTATATLTLLLLALFTSWMFNRNTLLDLEANSTVISETRKARDNLFRQEKSALEAERTMHIDTLIENNAQLTKAAEVGVMAKIGATQAAEAMERVATEIKVGVDLGIEGTAIAGGEYVAPETVIITVTSSAPYACATGDEDDEGSIGSSASAQNRNPTPVACIPDRDSQIQVTSGAANMRTGPGFAYAILRTMTADDTLYLLGRSDDSFWYRIETEAGTKGWVHTSTSKPLSLLDLPVVPGPVVPTSIPATAVPPTPVPPRQSNNTGGILINPNSNNTNNSGAVAAPNTPTPWPSNTPRPANTTQPINTVAPTNTPFPTNTTRPTNTPLVPTSTPVFPTTTPFSIPTATTVPSTITPANTNEPTIAPTTAPISPSVNATDTPFVVTVEPIIQATDTVIPPTNTAVPPTNTAIPPTNTAIPPTNTAIPPTNTAIPPTNTAIPPTNTAIPPTNTAIPPTNTVIPPTNTVIPPTNTVIPPTNTVIPPTNTVIPPTDTAVIPTPTQPIFVVTVEPAVTPVDTIPEVTQTPIREPAETLPDTPIDPQTTPDEAGESAATPTQMPGIPPVLQP